MTITFSKNFAGTDAPPGARVMISWSWVLYILAVSFGVWSMMALTGSLSQAQSDINRANIRLPAVLQIVCFVVGLVLTVWAGVRAL